MPRPRMPHTPTQRSTTYDVDSPCPRCGSFTLVGFSLVDTKGKFQHSHIFCTTWAGDAPVKDVDVKNLWLQGGGAACGWHGWSMPDHRTSVYPHPDCPPDPPTDPLSDAIILFLWEEGARSVYSLDSHLYDLGFGDESIQEKKQAMVEADELWMETVHGNDMVGLPKP